MRVNKYAGKLPMASFNKKTWRTLCVITKKIGVKKIHNCFCKYAIVDNQVSNTQMTQKLIWSSVY